MALKSKRWLYACLTILVMVSGLLSRHFSAYLPEVVNAYLGDVLWAGMILFGWPTLLPQLATPKVMLLAVSFCFLIEFSQLSQAEWLEAIRGTTLGGLVLGYGFLWRDLVAYVLGILGAGLLHRQIKSGA